MVVVDTSGDSAQTPLDQLLDQPELKEQVRQQVKASLQVAVPNKSNILTKRPPQQPIYSNQTQLIDGNRVSVRNHVLANGHQQHAPVKAMQIPVAKNGSMRHFLAILALSSIFMANMNRQAYNQALTRMIKKPHTRTSDGDETITTLEMLNSTQSQVSSTSPNFDIDSIVPFAGDRSDDLDATSRTLDQGDAFTADDQIQAEQSEETFDWTGAQLSLLQSGFSYGYTFFMIPGGRLSEIYGAKWIIFLSGFGSALCSILTPFFANHSFALLVASRIFMGLCQTGVSPALYAFCTRWLPPDESSVYLPMIKVGVMIGFAFGSLINGFLPWQTLFYVVGSVGFVWSALWAFFVTSDPKDHSFLNPNELEYIQQSLARQQVETTKARVGNNLSVESQDIESNDRTKSQKSSAPWVGLLTNKIVLAFTITKFTVKLSTDAQTIQIPQYMTQVVGVPDQLNGMLNGANFAIQGTLTGFVAYIAKEMIMKRSFGLNKTGVRLLFQCCNNFGMAAAYLMISFSGGSLGVVCGAVICLSFASMLNAGGEAVVPVDLTTQYSASIMAIANSVANLSGIILPRVVSYFLDNQLNNDDHWTKVWWFVSAVLVCGGTIFGCFVEAKIQDFESKRGEKRQVSTEVEAKNFVSLPKSSTNEPNELMTKL